MSTTIKRLAGTTRAFGKLRPSQWGRKEISLKVKLNILNAVELPVPLYDATPWTPTLTNEKRPDACEMRMLKCIMGVIWENFMRNVDIRERLQQLTVSLKLRGS